MNIIDKIRKYHVDDIIKIYDVPHQIKRIDKTHIATEESSTYLPWGKELVLWAWDEVEDIPVNEFWMKQLEIPVFESKADESFDGIYYDRSIMALRYKEYTFNDETVSEFQQSFYKLFGKLPNIKLPGDE